MDGSSSTCRTEGANFFTEVYTGKSAPVDIKKPYSKEIEQGFLPKGTNQKEQPYRNV